MNRRDFLLHGGMLFGASRLRGQEEPPTFSTEVKVVNVLATVRNKRGEIIRDLTKDDFSVIEDRRTQAIRYFSRESDLPLTLGLMVDTSMSQRRVMEQERAASFRFLDAVLRETKDRVFIMQFDMSVQLREALTGSLRKLNDSLAFVDTPTRQELEYQSGGGTLLYDAVVKASKDIMEKQTGRKALIVLSDGVDVGSEAGIEEAVAAAERADTLIYSILFSDANAYGLGPFGAIGAGEGKAALMRLSRETGGGFFAGSKKHGLDEIFQVLQEELRSQYNIGYVSDRPVSISEFRKIQVLTRQKGLIVQARDRYWAKR